MVKGPNHVVKGCIDEQLMYSLPVSQSELAGNCGPVSHYRHPLMERRQCDSHQLALQMTRPQDTRRCFILSHHTVSVPQRNSTADHYMAENALELN